MDQMEEAARQLWEWGRVGDVEWEEVNERGQQLYRERAAHLALLVSPPAELAAQLRALAAELWEIEVTAQPGEWVADPTLFVRLAEQLNRYPNTRSAAAIARALNRKAPVA